MAMARYYKERLKGWAVVGKARVGILGISF